MYNRFFLRDIGYVIRSRAKRNTYRNTDKSGLRLIFFIIVFIGLSYFSFSSFEARIKPTMIAMAEAKAKVASVKAINEGILDEVVKNIKYEDLVTIGKDGNSKIAAIQYNVIKLNEIQSKTTYIVQEKLENINNSELKIPVGSIFSSTIFAGLGPKITIKIIPIGIVENKFTDEFVSAGINQTKHKINLIIKENISVVVPLMQLATTVETSIPVAETIIVGDVPQTYLDARNASDSIKSISGNLTVK